jgi:gliding motility-associated-like protein
VHALPDADFDFKVVKNKLCLEDSIWFEAKNNLYNWSYTWAPAHSFNNINSAGIWGRLENERSTITLTVVDPFGCKNSSSKDLFPQTCCNVYMPTAFTPNGDGKNDKYRPVFTGFHRFHIFRVTNRWGQTIFESTDSDAKWDGTYNGVPQDMGVYFYYIKYDCGGKVLEQKGDCSLVR